MELILINDTKLKIMLTDADMERYELDCNCVNYNNTETRRAFWSILDEAKHQTGFDAASDKVFIQLYPSKEGGCEMYVTKIGTLRSLQAPPSQTDQPALTEQRHIVFSFASINDLISACRLICSSRINIQSAAWIDDIRTCYLFLIPDMNINMSPIYGIMAEFGSSLKHDNIASYIKEHGKMICSSYAIEKLSVL